jgi:hypothetical protein
MINSISPNDLVADGSGSSNPKTTQKKFSLDEEIPDY